MAQPTTSAVTDADFASLTDDAVEVDPNASVADAPPPPLPGYYPIKLSLVKDHPLLIGFPGIAKKTDDGKGIKSIRCDVSPTISEQGGEYDKRFLERIFASTATFNDTSWADDIVKACNGGKLPYGGKRDHKAAWKAMAQALKNDPVVCGEVDWKLTDEAEATVDPVTKGKLYPKDFIKSAHSSNWPKKASDGTPVVLDADPATKKSGRTRAFVKRVLPLNMLPQLRAAEKAKKVGMGGGASGGTTTGAPSTGPAVNVPMVD
jgi:hypothetical protein